MVSLADVDFSSNDEPLPDLSEIVDDGFDREPRGARIGYLKQLELFRRLKLFKVWVDGANVDPPAQYAVLRAIADRQPTCFISLKKLVQESGGFGQSTVRRALKALESLRLIRTQTFKNRTYRILDWQRLSEFAKCQE